MWGGFSPHFVHTIIQALTAFIGDRNFRTQAIKGFSHT